MKTTKEIESAAMNTRKTQDWVKLGEKVLLCCEISVVDESTGNLQVNLPAGNSLVLASSTFGKTWYRATGDQSKSFDDDQKRRRVSAMIGDAVFARFYELGNEKLESILVILEGAKREPTP